MLYTGSMDTASRGPDWLCFVPVFLLLGILGLFVIHDYRQMRKEGAHRAEAVLMLIAMVLLEAC